MKSNLIVPVIGIVLIGGFIWWARPGANRVAGPEDEHASHHPATPSALPAGILSPDKTSYDFGTISMAKGKVSTAFALTNMSSTSIQTSRLYTSCMCTSAKFVQGGWASQEFGMPGHGFLAPMERTIAPGQRAQIVVTFDPAAHGPAGVGKIARAVRLETDKGSLELTFSADVTP